MTSGSTPGSESGADEPAAAPPQRADPLASGASARIASVDLARGAVMVLMALDHVRVFAGIPAGGPTPALFFTRWVTHFCAPAFVFLAGTSAFLRARRRGPGSRALALRGLWLVALELTLVRWSWTFNLGWDRYLMAGVLWAIGWSMVCLAGLARLPLAAVLAVGLVLVGGHDLLDARRGAIFDGLDGDPLAWLWKILWVGFYAEPIRLGADGPQLVVLYSLVPWVGVMALGYAFGRVLVLEPRRRARACLALGLGATALFVVLRATDAYGDPRPWRALAERPGGPPAVLAFLDASKYPASLSFLLMTLGPTLALLPLLERLRGPLARWLALLGRVPLFYYLLHIPLLHALALAVSALREGRPNAWLFADHPMGAPPPPAGYAWSLGLLYATWGVALVLLTLACRAWASWSARRAGRLRLLP